MVLAQNGKGKLDPEGDERADTGESWREKTDDGPSQK